MPLQWHCPDRERDSGDRVALELLIRCPHLGYSGEVPSWFRRQRGKRIVAEQAADAARGSERGGNGVAPIICKRTFVDSAC